MWAVGDQAEADASKRHPGHKVYPYLLRGKTIDGRKSGSQRTCMGLFPSSGCFLGFAHSSLFGAGEAVLGRRVLSTSGDLPGAIKHPGLLHLHVHLMEMSPHPEPALVTGDFSLGEPSEVWKYLNAAGELEGYICRFEVKPDGSPDKEFRLYRYGCLTDGTGRRRLGWHWRLWCKWRGRIS
jgi:hypothetical protein